MRFISKETSTPGMAEAKGFHDDADPPSLEFARRSRVREPGYATPMNQCFGARCRGIRNSEIARGSDIRTANETNRKIEAMETISSSV
jgi:hypothetical protein